MTLHRHSLRVLLGITVLTLGWLLLRTAAVPVHGNDPPAQPADKDERSPSAWTLDEALEQLSVHPRDAYLQYVVLQLARREDRLTEVAPKVEKLVRETGEEAEGGGRSPNLFGLFTGGLAVQESLQLDALRGEAGRPAPKEPAEQRRKERVKVADLGGPTVESHPWEKMLAGKKPDVGPLAGCVPDDFFLAEFRSVAKLMEALSASELWGHHLFTQALGAARAQGTAERFQKQLGLAGADAEALDGIGVDAVAAAGSDLYLAEGSDLTLLFRGSKPDALRDHLKALLARTEKQPGVERTEGTYLGVAYTRVATADRSVDAYAAEPAPGLHVRGNSLAALKRVLEAVKGKTPDGQAIRRLGETQEYAYLRTLMPRGAAEEDGFVYLSDPFIRRLVGPQLKIAERRRMVAYNHLRMIGHAALLFRTEHGRAPKSLKELADSRCAPGVFGEGELACPGGGRYELSADGMSGVCSLYGRADFLTPCLEIPLTEVSGEEADGYQAFLKAYSDYWPKHFDPVAVRVQLTPQRYRLETVILPLIDNSIYSTLATAVGGKESALDVMPVSKRNILTVAFKINKEPWLEVPVEGDQPKAAEPDAARRRAQSLNNLKEIGIALHNYDSTFDKLPRARDAHPPEAVGKGGLSWRVMLLPFLEQDDLYKQFKHDEPWDSDHNKKLIARMPKVFQGANAKLNAEGKTPYLGVAGKDMFFPPDGAKRRITEIADGTSKTVAVVEAVDERAVVWTKPDDWEVDPKKPLDGVVRKDGGDFLVLVGDGSVRGIRSDADPKTWLKALTVADGEPVDLETISQSGPGPFGVGLADVLAELVPEGVDRAKVKRFVLDGLGDQLALNIHDASKVLDLDWSNRPDFAAGPLKVGGVGIPGLEGMGGWNVIGLIIHLLTSPLSAGIPVKDVRVVDEFLDEVDKLLAGVSVEKDDWGPKAGDRYRTKVGGKHTVRCYSVRFIGLKWRVFWGRIGHGLYVANAANLLEEIAAAEDERAGRPAAAANGPTGHAMLRVRPENWDQVKAGLNLGSAENERQACLENMRAIHNVARGWNDRRARDKNGEVDAELLGRTAQVYGGLKPYCPEGGRYTLLPDGRGCACSVHGDPLASVQPDAPGPESTSGRVLRTFGGLTATLSFLEDGLRAVVVVDRK